MLSKLHTEPDDLEKELETIKNDVDTFEEKLEGNTRLRALINLPYFGLDLDKGAHKFFGSVCYIVWTMSTMQEQVLYSLH